MENLGEGGEWTFHGAAGTESGVGSRGTREDDGDGMA